MKMNKSFRDVLRFISEQDARTMLAHSTLVRLECESLVIAEGHQQRALHVVVSGILRVEKEYLGTPVPIAELIEGDIFGEMSLVGDTTASASVVTETAAQLRVIDGHALATLFAQDPEFGARFYRSIADLLATRLRASNLNLLSAAGV